MGQGQLEIVERLFSAWEAGDFSGGLEDFDANVTYVVRPPFPEPAVVTGVEEIGRYMLGFFKQFAPGSHTVAAEDFREVGDTVVTRVVQHAVGRSSGVAGDLRFWVLFSFRGGKIIRLESILDEGEALEAAGLNPGPSDRETVSNFLERAAVDPASVWDIFDDDVEWELAPESAPDFPRVSRGPEAVAEFFRIWAGTFEDWGYEVEEVTDGPGWVAVRIRQWGRGKGSGVPVDASFWQVYVMRDGRAVRVVHREDRDEALAAARVSE